MQQPSIKILSQIALIQSVLITLPDKHQMLEFVCSGLEDIPGVAGVDYCIHENSIEQKTPSNNNDISLRNFLIKLKDQIFAELIFEISDSNSFNPYPPFIMNLTSMLAIIFEERRMKALSYERTIALQKSEVLEKLALGAPLNEVLTALVVNYENHSPDTLCSVLLVDKDGKHLDYVAAPNLPNFYKKAVNNMSVGLDAGPCGVSAFTGKRVIVDNLKGYQYRSNYNQFAEKAGLHACWSEPIKSSSGDTLGAFTVYYCESRSPSQSDLRFIQDSARLAAITTERHTTVNSIKESEEMFRSLFEQAGGYAMILEPTKSGIPKILDVNQAACLAHDYTKSEMIGKLVAELDDEEGKKLCIERTKLIMSGKPFTIETNHVRKDGSIFPVAVFANKVQLEGKPPIILTTEYDISERKRSEAKSAALLQQNSNLTKRLFKLQEDERRYIVSELHDELGQWITALDLSAHYISMQSKDTSQDIFERAEEIKRNINQMHDTIRGMIDHLRPTLLDLVGLSGSLKGLIEQWQFQNPQIMGSLSIDAKLDELDDDLSVTIYRIIQESLNNAAKYSKADAVTVQITSQFENLEKPENLILTIKDNGCGIDTLQDSKGTGLHGMHTRALAIGADFTLESYKGEGLSIKVEFPMKNKEKSK